MKRHDIILIFITLSIGVVMAYLAKRFNFFGFNKTSYNVGNIGSTFAKNFDAEQQQQPVPQLVVLVTKSQATSPTSFKVWNVSCAAYSSGSLSYKWTITAGGGNFYPSDSVADVVFYPNQFSCWVVCVVTDSLGNSVTSNAVGVGQV